MAATPKNSSQSPSKFNLRSRFSPTLTPITPQYLPPRRSQNQHATPERGETRENQSEIRKRKRKREGERTVATRTLALKKREKIARVHKIRAYYEKVVYDGADLEVGDDVYVKRREDATSDDEDPEVEECRLCFCSGDDIMIECDHCLGGFHLKCLTPPLKDVPEGDWICGFCEARKMGRGVDFPKPPEGKKLVRTMTQKLLSSDLWAARIESIWKEVDGNYWCQVRWYVVPEETSIGRQSHNLSRELYRTNDFADIEMESVLRHCYVMTPKEYAKANNEGNDVYLCEYEYDIHWHSFKRLADIDHDRENCEETDSDEDWNIDKESDSDTDEDVEYEEENIKNAQSQPPTSRQLAANLHKGRFFGLQKIGTKRIPQHIRSHKQTNLERAKSSLLLASLPKSLPCRNKEMEEITTFIKGAISISDNQCLGRCLYIHGVPGTGKTMSVLAVMRSLRSELYTGNIEPYHFVEVNSLKLALPQNIYKVIYEALSGHRVHWEKALYMLNERFVEGKKTGEEANRPCILLIDELDHLVTRNQSVLYNILDWTTRPHSKLIVIGISNTMDLQEKLLPRISSRMGIHRLCFAPYKHEQLQEIISSRLKGINVFDEQAIIFASKKVALISGDARRALEICRHAVEIADYRMKKLTSNPDFTTAGSKKSLKSLAQRNEGMSESNLRSQFSSAPTPVTPQYLPPRRSLCSKSLLFDSPKTPNLVDASCEAQNQHATPERGETRENQHASPDQWETMKGKREREVELECIKSVPIMKKGAQDYVQEHDLVGISDVKEAIQEIDEEPHIQFMKHCSRHNKIYLTALVYESHKTGMEVTTFERLAETFLCLCTSNGEKFPGYDSLLKLCCILGEMRIILCEPGRMSRWTKVQLNVSSDDVVFSLRDCKEIPWLSKYLM